MANSNLPHILLTNIPEPKQYTTISSFPSPAPLTPRDRRLHGEYLRRCFNQSWDASQDEMAVSHATRNGFYLEFISDPGAILISEGLENLKNKKIRLLNVRTVETPVTTTEGVQHVPTTYATVYVANEERRFFANKIEEFLTVNTATGKPRHQPLLQSIAHIRKALLVNSFWCDAGCAPPEEKSVWVEVWLSSDSADVMASFDQLLNRGQIESRPGVLYFPERAVKVIFANRAQLEWLSLHSDSVAEYRAAKSTANFFTNLTSYDQADWSEQLLGRIQVQANTPSVVCVLDTGVNHGHPLLAPLINEQGCHSVNPDWGTHDHHKHGTLMAGIAAYGSLVDALESNHTLQLTHSLESVKLLPPPPENTRPDLWGYVTSQAISRAEIQAPDKIRCICMAVTATETRERGRPTSWSAGLDQITSGATDDTRRLIIVSAGNACSGDVTQAGVNYPNVQLTDSVHDPAQAWNALTIGACTSLVSITDNALTNYTPVAPSGGLSPFSTTSLTWEGNQWPVKPELVMEGGNLAIDPTGFVTECDDLSVLSTYYEPHTAHFYPFNMTSAATAKVSWMAGQLQAHYPSFWPETIRGLLVHSAEWTASLKRQFLVDESKTSYKNLLGACGYGVPDLVRAKFSATNSLTLVAQASLQPFDKRKGSGYRTRDMHLYELPWPAELLLDLPDGTPVSMRITLSYFIEPGPGEVGWKDRYRYASHGLRFDLNSPGESMEEFAKRINKAAREEDEGAPGTQSPAAHWVLGANNRDRGSLHSDIWKGTAQQLARSSLIAITPTIGWWRERPHLGKWGKETRYALIVSISTPDESVDVYTPVAISLGIMPPIVAPIVAV